MDTTTYSELQKAAAILGHLRSQFEMANPILFTGAGFSVGARNTSGRPIPGVKTLREALWKLCFGDDPFEDNSSLQDLFQIARKQRRKELTELMIREFTVDSKTLPPWYQTIFSFPWHRIYTLNIDNLEAAANKSYQLPRQIQTTSATAQTETNRVNERKHLHVIHLNGTLDDIPDNVTFSFRQYAERLAREEPWFGQLTSDLLSRPVVFIGTELDEPPLWQYIEKRKARGGREQKELRPKSYLIIPTISRARKASLIEYNILHLSSTGEQFTSEILTPLLENSERGQAFLRSSEATGNQASTLQEVAQIAINPTEKTEFLLGSEPNWSDIQSGRAALREIDNDITDSIRHAQQQPRAKGIIAISGTAGTGKSTSLKRAALNLSSSGKRVAWIDLANDDVSPLIVRNYMRGAQAPSILVIDDADLFGSELSPLLRDVCLSDNFPLVIIAIRSGRYDRVINPTQLDKIAISEITMPNLSEVDIDALLEVLTRENRLGVLRKIPIDRQKQIFREKCGRQLLVAMIEATSGKPFHEKVWDEFSELEGITQRIYATISLASAHRFFLNKNDIILASDNADNETLNAIDTLARRNLIKSDNTVRFTARHRMIADLVFNRLTTNGEAGQIIADLTRSAALQINPGDRATRHQRIVRFFTNHEFLKTAIGSDESMQLYGELEDLLSNDHNFWLQRGSLAVEVDNLYQAENFLGQARALNPKDMNVQTEYGYLLFRKAISNPSATEATKYIEEATSLLRSNIAMRGAKDPHSYHVLGNNMLEWIEIGIPDYLHRKTELETLISEIKEGFSRHPGNPHLKVLVERLEHTYLSMAVRGNKS